MTHALIRGNQVAESFHTLLPDSDDPIQSLSEKLRTLVLGENRSQVVEVRVFGSIDRFGTIREILKDLPGSGEWPVSLLDGTPAPGGGVAGIQLHLVRGAPVDTIRLGDAVVGRAFQDGGARFCVLGGVGPRDPAAPPAEQASVTLLRMEEALRAQGMEMKDLVRTWFFLDDILRWYGDFNEARTRFFQSREIFEGFVPASTGIGGANHFGSALLASRIAVKSGSPDVAVREVPSPMQCPAGSYGSSFSRAAELADPGFRRLFVSGTASIDARGRTAHVGHVEDQMRLTFRVVEAILESRGMGFGDVLRGNAYFRSARHATAMEPTLRELGIPRERFLISRNTVCRDDLLFEMEVDAVRQTD